MATRSFLDLSTSHLSPAAQRYLDVAALNGLHWKGKHIPYGIELREDEDKSNRLIVGHVTYGWFVHVPENPDEQPYNDAPKTLHDLLLYARGRQLDYILFDADAPILEILPTFD